MRKINALDPTDENIIETLNEDALGRNADLIRFAEFCDLQDNSCAIALSGAWGSGKTFFVRQLQMFMNAQNEFIHDTTEKEKQATEEAFADYQKHYGATPEFKSEIVYYYDAWSNDNDLDPLLSIILQIAIESDQESVFKNPNLLKLFKTVTSSLTTWKFNINSNPIFDTLDALKGEDLLESIKKQKSLQKDIQEFLSALIPENGERMIIIIDELDRCRPDFAVRLLERVKHYLSDERITFIFSINEEQLQHTVKRYYGEDFDASRYLDRFFDFRIPLPKANMEKFYQTIGLGVRYHFEEICKAVISYYHFGLREIMRFYQEASMAAGKVAHKERTNGIEEFGIKVLVPIIIGTRIADINKYEKFIRGEDSTPLIDLAKEDRIPLYCKNLLLGYGETFMRESKGDKKYVNYTDRLQQVYEGIFTTQLDDEWHETHINGQLTITEGTRNLVAKVASVISEYSDFDTE